ncbi:MAG: DUF3575 domain-containing protein [Bacteroidia bacterium]
MKKLISLFILSAICLGANAQTMVVKTNLLGYGLAAVDLTTINANFEYKISPKNSIGIVGAIKPASTMTLKATGTTNDDKLQYTGEISPKGYSLTPYFRMYSKDALKGFYFEVFARYFSYNFEIPYDYDKNGSNIRAYANGSASAFGGGVVIGTQVPIGKMFVLDFYGGLGLGVGNAHAETDDPNLEEEDFADIKKEMDELKANGDVNIIIVGNIIDNMTYDANKTSAWADIDGFPVPMLRGGISFGILF